jgi:HlyD family secretion protein
MLERQVTNCTIRAPHDGFVIHANDARRGIYVEEGMPVFQKQRLFFLPDLTEMEIVAQLHESVVDEVRPGMRAMIDLESLPDCHLKGQVSQVAPLATFEWRSDVRYFDATVKLSTTPPGLRPGMTAELAIEMPRRQNVLAVPSEAVTTDEGRNVCFVVHDAGLERREVKLGGVTLDLTEVAEGLHEGEHVVLNPHVDEEDLSTPDDDAPAESRPTQTRAPGVIAALH